MLELIAVVWVVIGVFTYGAVFGHWQNKYPDIAEEWYGRDMAIAIGYGLLGPIGLLGAMLGAKLCKDSLFKYGLKFK